MIEYINEIMIVLAIILILLTAFNTFWNRDLIISTKKKCSDSNNTLGVYYLPKSIFKFSVITNVLVEIDENGQIESTKISSQDFKTSTNIVADTTTPIYLNYRHNPFSDEEISLNINENGLLENFVGTSENKIDDILFSLTDFKSESLITKNRAFEVNFLRKKKAVRIIERQYERVFEIDPLNLLKGDKIVDWDIKVFSDLDIDITEEINAGFTLSLNNKSDKLVENGLGENKDIKGLLFRMYDSLDIKIVSDSIDLDSKYISLSCLNPNLNYNIPIKTTPFAKRTHSLKIKNGILTEHILKNPSSIAGFASIPVKVGKSIMSIPAQLISIEIGNKKKINELNKLEIQSEKELLEAEKKLLDAKSELAKAKGYFNEFRVDAKNEIDRLDQIIENLKSRN